MSGSDIALVLAVVSVAGILYPHLLYPLLLLVVHRFRRDPVRHVKALHPALTVVVAAYNEADYIVDCLDSIVGNGYPAPKISIIVGDDGSDDDTAGIVLDWARRHAGVDIVLHRCERSGKNGVLRRIIPLVRTDVTVFTDADTRLQAGALEELMAPFADDRTGAVLGKNDRGGKAFAGDSASEGEAMYRSMEDKVNVLESEVASTMASNGALYAVRTALLRPLPDSRVADDWMNVLFAILAGRRAVFTPHARAVEYRPNDMAMEMRRTVRTVASGFACVGHAKRLLSPTSGIVAWLLWSHRILRWLSPVFLVMLFVATILAVDNVLLFGLLFYGQFVLYALALLGHAAERFGSRIPVIGAIQFFVAMNMCFLAGMYRSCTGRRLDAWKPATERTDG